MTLSYWVKLKKISHKRNAELKQKKKLPIELHDVRKKMKLRARGVKIGYWKRFQRLVGLKTWDGSSKNAATFLNPLQVTSVLLALWSRRGERNMKLLIEFVSFNIYYFFIWNTAGYATTRFPRRSKHNNKQRAQ